MLHYIVYKGEYVISCPGNSRAGLDFSDLQRVFSEIEKSEHNRAMLLEIQATSKRDQAISCDAVINTSKLV